MTDTAPGPDAEPGGAVLGADGIARCGWGASSPDYIAYHDAEWGVPVHGERALFERITLEGFQSGLSFITILRKREGFRAAFARFDPQAVAAFDDEDRVRLMSDVGIVRNRQKVDAAITNAAAVVALREHGGLDELVWSHAPAHHQRPATLADVPATSPESVALATSLKRSGFVFVGPTTMYAAMQACGLVDDHVEGCHRAGST